MNAICRQPANASNWSLNATARSLPGIAIPTTCGARSMAAMAVVPISAVFMAVLFLSSGAQAQSNAPGRAAVKSMTTTLVSSGAYKDCFGLSAQQKLRYWYRAESAVDFNIQTVEGGATLYPVKKDRAAIGSGTFQPRIVAPATSQDYCVVWTNTAKRPVTLTFEFARVGG